MTPLLARAFIGSVVRDDQGNRLGRVRDIGFHGGEIRYLATERGVYEVRARSGGRLIAGRPASADGHWLRHRPQLETDPGRAVHDLVLGCGLSVPLYVVSRGLVQDVLRGRELIPSSRAVCVGTPHDLP